MGPYPGPGPGPALLPATSGGHQWRPVQTSPFENPHPPMVLMSGGESTYVWQVGGMHPTRMLFLVLLNNFKHSSYLIYMKCNQKPLLLGKDTCIG